MLGLDLKDSLRLDILIMFSIPHSSFYNNVILCRYSATGRIQARVTVYGRPSLRGLLSSTDTAEQRPSKFLGRRAAVWNWTCRHPWWCRSSGLRTTSCRSRCSECWSRSQPWKRANWGGRLHTTVCRVWQERYTPINVNFKLSLIIFVDRNWWHARWFGHQLFWGHQQTWSAFDAGRMIEKHVLDHFTSFSFLSSFLF